MAGIKTATSESYSQLRNSEGAPNKSRRLSYCCKRTGLCYDACSLATRVHTSSGMPAQRSGSTTKYSVLRTTVEKFFVQGLRR